MKATVKRAGLFLATNARILDRLRYARLFERGSSESTVAALRAYQNEDGGFGHALEPDLRGPESEPVSVWTALDILDEMGRLDRSAAAPILRYLDSISAPKGGVPFVLHEASNYPHAPWWETKPGKQPPSLNPTAGICGLLYKNRIADPWLRKASDWCWAEIDRTKVLGPYDARVVLHFLDHVPDRRRAAAVLEQLRPSILKRDVVDLSSTAKGHVHRPVDFSPEPNRLSRTLFDEKTIERNLDAIERDQRPDGGWAIHFPIWTPITGFEWRGVHTVDMLRVLRANGRISVL